MGNEKGIGTSNTKEKKKIIVSPGNPDTVAGEVVLPASTSGLSKR